MRRGHQEVEIGFPVGVPALHTARGEVFMARQGLPMATVEGIEPR